MNEEEYRKGFNEAFETPPRYRRRKQMNEWVNVKNRLPTYNLNVLIVINGNENIRIGFVDQDNCWLDEEHWCVEENGEVKVTHWMPLPEPPTN